MTILDLSVDAERGYDLATETLMKGALVVAPVGGVYGVLADAFSAKATQRLFAARRAMRKTPLSVLIRSERQVSGLVAEVPEAADRLMATYWPGNVTLILAALPDMSWDLGINQGTVQLRRPADDFLLKLIAEVGPLAVSTANRPGTPKPLTVAAAQENLGAVVPVYLDGGEQNGDLSTIVDCTGEDVVVLREGAVKDSDIFSVAAGETGWGEQPEG